MAAVLSFDRNDGPSREEADAAMLSVIDHVSHLPARLAVPLINRYRCQFDAAEARALATVIDATGSTKVAESIAGKGDKTSRSARRRSAKRAAAVEANRDLADKCSAHHSTCQAHHIMPWTSPAKGNTNINELALVCENCHRRLHENEQTLHRGRRSGLWKLRPALAHELPAKRPPRPNNGQAPQLT